MVSGLRRSALIAVAAVACGAGFHFYPDDPLEHEPPPVPVGKLPVRMIDDGFDLLMRSFQRRDRTPPRAGNINTIDEVPDGAWFINRPDDAPLVQGDPPSFAGPWKIVRAKTEGSTPGFEVRDSRKKKYLLKFDPPTNPSMTAAADVIGSHFFRAFGYHVPDNHIVVFDRSQVVVEPGAPVYDASGIKRPMEEADIDKLLAGVHRRLDGKFRALASKFIEGEIIGPWLYHGTRSDDPNDLVPHEDRRELRGLYVFAAWLNHHDATALNTLDAIVEENGIRYVKHYLIDFGSILGAGSLDANDPQNGFVYQFDRGHAMREVASAGLYVPRWQRVKYPNLPEVGRFESEVFDPLHWKPVYANPAFENRLPDDTFWAAKKLMRMPEASIRAIVATGRYEDPLSEQQIVRTLLERREKLTKAFFSSVLPFDRFRIESGRIVYEKLSPKPASGYHWYTFDNARGRVTRLDGEDGVKAPVGKGEYLAVEITGTPPSKKVWVYIRNGAVIGIRREW